MVRNIKQKEESQYNYNKLRLDVIESLINHRGIECKNNRTDMIRHLLLYDEGNYVRETEIEKFDGNKFLIGIDIAHQDLLVKMGKLVESGEAKRSHAANCRQYYISNINILEDEVD